MKPLSAEHFNRVLEDVADQVFAGKGKERHGRDKPLEEQSWKQIAELQKSHKFLTGQALKKIMEMELHDFGHEAWLREAHGAIVYLVLACMWKEHESKQTKITDPEPNTG